MNSSHISNLYGLVNISSVRWIATVGHAVWKRLPRKKEHSDQNDRKDNQDVELNGKILYQNENIQEETQTIEESEKDIKPVSEMSKSTSSDTGSDYSPANISMAIVYVLFMDLPIWALKYCVFHPNLILMFLYAILPSHVWFRLFPQLLTLLRRF